MSIQLNGYNINEEIYSGANAEIYRGVRQSDHIPVIIKYLNKEFPSSEELSRFNREYQITLKISGDGVIRTYALEKHNNSLVMINEDIGGSSLGNHLSKHKMSLEDKISLAIRISDAIGQIHQHSVIHKDINPSNIIWNTRTGALKITDFGISSELSRENPEIRHPNILEGTLAYISPEQTGRMNTSIDYRSDIYSLGATFYELFTGVQPFTADDAMGLVHCHIAVNPRHPHHIDEHVPEALSAIILKLMAKAPEERYQSMIGLKKDLEICLDHIRSGEPLDNFIPGRNDFSGHFQIPQKLYGRENNITELLSAFDRVAHGSKEIVLVSGYSGIGKSALIHEVNKPIVEKRGNFITGKFDQYKRNIPYSALIHAFQELVKNILAEDEERLADWRDKLLKALGPSGRIVIDVIPDIELIIGKQPDVQELGPDQTRNRFNIVFQNFIRVFASEDHPLCLFIDDLQWADLSSISLIEQFMLDTDTSYLLIIGAYRDNETDPAHPLIRAVNHLEKNDITVQNIRLKPLGLDHVNRLISDSMNLPPEKSLSFATLCSEKTMGNPFFLYHLLFSFYENKSISFDSEQGVWLYDITKINHADITENVVDLMVSKIMKLSALSQETIKLAACIGNTFDIETLSLLSNKSRSETAGILFEILEERLIIPMDNNYKLISEMGGSLNAEYKFLHDRILQAAYSLTPLEEKKKIHLTIGRTMLENIPPEEQNEKLFDIVNHLNHGIDLITAISEKDILSELNHKAGQKAIQSAAYKTSYDYFITGIQLCGEDGWERNYERMLSLHTEAMESAYLNSNYVELEKFYIIITERAKTVLDKSKAMDVKLLFLYSLSQFKEAIDTGLKYLKQLGIYMPTKPNKIHIIYELVKTKIMLRHHTNETIIGSQTMSDPVAIATASVLHKLASTALFSNPSFLPLTIFKRLQLSLLYGKDPQYSLSSFSGLGLILCSIGQIEEGYRYGQLSENLLSRSPIKKEKTRIIVVMNSFIRHWKDPIRDTLKPLLSGYESKIETGDIEFASHAVCMYCIHLLICGMDLKITEQEQVKFIKPIRSHNQKHDMDTFNLFYQNTLNLRDPEKPLTEFSGTIFDESVMLPILRKEGNMAALFGYHICKIFADYISGEYYQAFIHAEQAASLLTSVRSMAVIPFFTMYDSLTRLALCASVPDSEKRKHLRIIEKNQKQMKHWAVHSPVNFKHKWHLVEAEKAAALNLPEKARYQYQLAIKGANENEFVNDEAVACERYALFLISRGEEDVSGFILNKARYCYDIWGAKAKVALMDKNHSHLLKRAGAYSASTIQTTAPIVTLTSETKMASTQTLDMESLLKSSRMISREIVLSKLIEKVLSISMENAGAEKGFVILEQNGKYCIEGEAAIGKDIKDNINVLKSIPIEKHPGLSPAIVNYVVRTKKMLILDDAANEGDFKDDPYVIKNKPKSILCNAFFNQGKLTAILYMENNLAKAAFRFERMDLLGALAAQAAISITNARLYENLEDKVRERTHELNLSLNEVRERTEELNITLKQVEEANEKVMASIRYSGIIQNSLLPDPASISSFLPESFFIWKPRDIIGGDIYVCEKIKTGVVVVMIDCTGHGVPGAFMTMLASSSIRRIILEEKIFIPADILKRLNYLIKTSLQQDRNHTRSDDGLDAAICFYDENEKAVYYSGAKLPLYYMCDGEIMVVKGDRQSIGYVSSDLSHEFKTTRIDNQNLSKTFYLATDGYTDQLGGEDTSRFGSRSLKKLLIENHHLPFDIQSQILLNAYEKHRGNMIRTDDMAIAGFRFT